MASLWLVLIVFLIFGNMQSIFSAKQDVYGKLKKKILANYSIRVRPIKDKKKQTTLSSKMHIFHIDKLNEKEQSVRIHGILQMSWLDEYLQWDYNDYNDTKFILMRNYEIWTPNVVLANSAKMTQSRYAWNLPVKVWYSGIIYASPEFALDVSCNFDFSDYPYDEQTCTMGLYVSGLSLGEIKWDVLSDPELRMYWPASQNKTQIADWKFFPPTRELKYWTYEGLLDVLPNKSDNRWILPIVEINLRFKRNDIYFTPTIVLPAVLTSMITIFAMCPFNKIKLALCLLIINFVIQCFYIDNLLECLPLSASGIPNISIFYAFNLVATTLGIILRVVVLYLNLQKKIVDNNLRKAIEDRINQERMPQALETSQPNKFREMFQLEIFQPEKMYYIVLAIYVFTYLLFSILYL